MTPRIKICCMSSRQEMRHAVRAGADALGFVSSMPSGPGVLKEDHIADLLRHVPPTVTSVLLTSQQTPDAIIQQHRRCPAAVLQLVDHVAPHHYATLRKALPGVHLMQVVHVTGPSSVEAAAALDGRVDAVLLDSGCPNADVKELGGTGRTHNWTWSRSIVNRLETPVFLAGGLNASNVGDALRTVQPFGVDLCSGVRTAGLLDPEKLRSFVRAVSRGN